MNKQLFGEQKNTFVPFINSEAKTVLKKFMASREIGEDSRIFRKGFGKSGITYRWHIASEKSGVKLIPSDLRDWFCNELGKLGVADIDISMLSAVESLVVSWEDITRIILQEY